MIDIMTSRFKGLSDPHRIREIVTQRPPAILGLRDMNAAEGGEQYEKTLMEIYLPNQSSVDFIKLMVERAERHSSDLYYSEINYQKKLNSTVEKEAFPVCLTGLAGVGKSQTIIALRKVLPVPVDLNSDLFMGSIKAESHWYASAREKKTGRQILIEFLGDSELSLKPTASGILAHCIRRAVRDGVSLTILEELQHMTLGPAVAQIVNVLLTLSGIGLPMVYVCNFSLLHKLFKRNSEEKQRLLSDPYVMLPDLPGSDAWREYINECARVSDGCLPMDDTRLMDEIYRMTFGVKRLVVHLLKIAYVESRQAGRCVIGLPDIQVAYRSAAYLSNRLDVEELGKQASQDWGATGIRLDLRCPFGIPQSYASEVTTYMKAARDRAVADKYYESSLTPEESSALKHVIKEFTPSKAEPKPEPKSRKPRAPKPSLQDLEHIHMKMVEIHTPKRARQRK